LRGTIAELGGSLLRPATAEAGKRLAAELFRPDGGSFNAVMDRIARRREARNSGASGDATSGSAPLQASRPSRMERRRGRAQKG